MPGWLLVTYLSMWAGGAVMTLLYRRRIRRRYPELGARLFPGLMDKTIQSDFAGVRFILRAEYRQLDDPAAVRLSEIYRATMLSFFAVFVVTVAVFLLRY